MRYSARRCNIKKKKEEERYARDSRDCDGMSFSCVHISFKISVISLNTYFEDATDTKRKIASACIFAKIMKRIYIGNLKLIEIILIPTMLVYVIK